MYGRSEHAQQALLRVCQAAEASLVDAPDEAQASLARDIELLSQELRIAATARQMNLVIKAADEAAYLQSAAY